MILPYKITSNYLTKNIVSRNHSLTFSGVKEKGPSLRKPSAIGWSGMEEYHMALHSIER